MSPLDAATATATLQAPKVRALSVQVLRLLLRLDPAWVGTLLRAIGRAGQGQEQAWLAAASDPRLDPVISASLDLLGGSGGRSPSGSSGRAASTGAATKQLLVSLLHSLRADDSLVQSTDALLSEHLGCVGGPASGIACPNPNPNPNLSPQGEGAEDDTVRSRITADAALGRARGGEIDIILKLDSKWQQNIRHWART
jgi:hypothetical protein